MVTLQQTQGWEPLWADSGAVSDYWRVPEQTVLAWAEQLWEAGGRRALDLGCGIGRHAVTLARMGFAVTATDVSPSGLATCAVWLARERLSATLACHEIETLPFPDCVFDGLVVYNVIYHATVAGIRRALAEVCRVLRPDGQLYATFITRDDSRVAGYQTDLEMGKCVEVEPFTFIYLRDAPGDKHLSHHYSDEAELRAFLVDFAVDDFRLVRVEYTDEDGVVQIGVHYHVQAHRL